MADSKPPQSTPGSSPRPPSPQPGGLEAPLAPTADPTKKTSYTHDPDATDPGNGAD